MLHSGHSKFAPNKAIQFCMFVVKNYEREREREREREFVEIMRKLSCIVSLLIPV